MNKRKNNPIVSFTNRLSKLIKFGIVMNIKQDNKANFSLWYIFFTKENKTITMLNDKNDGKNFDKYNELI